MRGTLGFFAETSFVAMNAVGAVCGMGAVLGQRLPLLVGLALLPALFAVGFVAVLRETPKFLLLKKGDAASASRSLSFYQDVGEWFWVRSG